MNRKSARILFAAFIIVLIIVGAYRIYEKVQLPKDIVKDETSAFAEYVFKRKMQNGDIIFQTTTSEESKVIQIATGSRYSHMGIIYKQGYNFFVCEANQVVELTPLDNWIKRGENRHFVIKRIKKSKKLLTPETQTRMKQIGEKFMGTKYDWYFEWSDSNLYCSELVWKIYKEAVGIEIGKLEKLGDFELTNTVLTKNREQIYEENIQKGEWVITPVSMFNSDNLVTVFEN